MIPPLPTSSATRRAVLGGAAASALLPFGLARAQARRTPVRVGVIPIVGAAPLFVAEGEGWLKQAGLDLTVTTFESGPNMIQALASGTIDVYVAGVACNGRNDTNAYTLSQTLTAAAALPAIKSDSGVVSAASFAALSWSSRSPQSPRTWRPSATRMDSGSRVFKALEVPTI